MTSTKQNFTREQRLIELIKQITAENLIGDDCAVLPGQKLISSDMLVEGKHFLLPQMKLEDLGWKAMAVNLSDIAGMGGTPEFATVNIAMPGTMQDEQFERLFASMHQCAREFGTRIVGGDLTGSDFLVISITVLGQAHPNGALMRSSARPGDIVFVTGDFGGSALGLELMMRNKTDGAACAYAISRHCRPQPRFKEARLLVEQCTSHNAALMDASDGLADALIQIASTSGLAIFVDEDKIPIAEALKLVAKELEFDPIELALYGGEDYELVGCVDPATWKKLAQTKDFSAIGIAQEGSDVSLNLTNGTRIQIDRNKTFQHWSPK